MLKKIFKLSGIGVLILLSVFIYEVCKSQEKPITPEVNYIQNIPNIDGILDENLQSLPVRKLKKKFDISLLNNLKKANYRIAYTVDYLYIYVEGQADSLICRDRGYQNGDGFIFLLADGTQEEKFTNDFYVYGFSAQTIEEQKWAEKVIWYKDNKVKLETLPENTQIRYKAHDNKISFELLLPWNCAYPYHPWSNKIIGTNLWMVKAIENKSIPIMKGIFWDLKLPSEAIGRKYKPLTFEIPKKTEEKLYWVLDRNNYFENDFLRIFLYNNIN
ncbi:MAG: hypothetical protein KOO66_13565, partial [Bacteroidales bacterium]|nr:hypothetical protein [Bacteroidales bacterium]